MTRRRPGLAGLDVASTTLRDATAEYEARLRAVIQYLTIASPQRALPSARLAPATARSGWDAAAAGSGRTGATSPVDPGPAA